MKYVSSILAAALLAVAIYLNACKLSDYNGQRAEYRKYRDMRR